MDSNEKRIEELYKAIISINDLEICKEFFDDLCTYKEIDMMAQRLEAAKKLIDGETYDTIIKSTDIQRRKPDTRTKHFFHSLDFFCVKINYNCF